MRPAPASRRGMALVNAIFLLVVLGLLGAFMVSIATVQQDVAVKSVNSARAYLAAKAGLEWGIRQAVAAGACAASTPLTLTEAALAGASVTVTCAASSHGAGNFVYYVTSTASTGGAAAPAYAERRMQATVSNLP